MAELIKAFEYDGEFNRELYFTVCFNLLSSNLFFEAPLKENDANMKAVLEAVDLDSQEMEVVYKNWSTENDQNADGSKDHVYAYLLKSKSKSLLVWLALDYKGLFAEFQYDCSDLKLEQWVISTNIHLRTKFGSKRQAMFKVLSESKNGFYTKDIRTEDFEADIQKMYNDDFIEIDEIIEKSLHLEKAGLILFHGAPGTGKTSYIKNLINKHRDKDFIFIQNEFINALLQPNFITFLLNQKNAVLIIEDAERVLMKREQVNENSVVSTVLQLTDGLFSDYLNIKIIATFNTSIDKIDKALLRKGRMIAYYEFQPLTSKKANELLKDLNLEPTDTPMTLADIYNYRNKGFNQSEKEKIGFKN
jgi:hypothetical protein